MTLILTMPERGIANQDFEKEEVDAVSPERGGRVGGVTLGFPIWRATYSLSRNLTRSASNEWRAFVARLRGSQRSFLAHDRDRLFPLAYPKGFAATTRPDGSVFDGAATGWSQTIDDDGDGLLQISGLPAGLKLGHGDYIGFKWDAAGSPADTFDRRTMARLVVSTQADASGTLTAVVEPPVPTALVPPAAIAHLDRPGCFMKAVPGQVRLGSLDRRQKIAGGTIAALQDLRP